MVGGAGGRGGAPGQQQASLAGWLPKQRRRAKGRGTHTCQSQRHTCGHSGRGCGKRAQGRASRCSQICCALSSPGRRAWLASAIDPHLTAHDCCWQGGAHAAGQQPAADASPRRRVCACSQVVHCERAHRVARPGGAPHAAPGAAARQGLQAPPRWRDCRVLAEAAAAGEVGRKGRAAASKGAPWWCPSFRHRRSSAAWRLARMCMLYAAFTGAREAV